MIRRLAGVQLRQKERGVRSLPAALQRRTAAMLLGLKGVFGYIDSVTVDQYLIHGKGRRRDEGGLGGGLNRPQVMSAGSTDRLDPQKSWDVCRA